MLASALASPATKRKFQTFFAYARHRSQPEICVGQSSGSEASEVRESRFVRLGRVELDSSNCRMTTFYLSDLNSDSLLGPVHLKMDVDITCHSEHQGFLTLHDGFLWHRRWCHLQDGEIHCWKDPKEVEKQV
jgi:hypothetical protein